MLSDTKPCLFLSVSVCSLQFTALRQTLDTCNSNTLLWRGMRKISIMHTPKGALVNIFNFMRESNMHLKLYHLHGVKNLPDNTNINYLGCSGLCMCQHGCIRKLSVKQCMPISRCLSSIYWAQMQSVES